MAALTAPRNTSARSGAMRQDPVAANVKLFQGGIALLDAAGNAVSNATAANLKAAGRVMQSVDNTGGLAGDVQVSSESGVFAYASDGSLTRAHVGKAVYVLDDQTLTATDQAGTRSATVILHDLQGAQAWARLGL